MENIVGKMAVKFYKDGEKYGVYVTDGRLDMIASTIEERLAAIGKDTTGISDLTIHHPDGLIEDGCLITNRKGILMGVGVHTYRMSQYC